MYRGCTMILAGLVVLVLTSLSVAEDDWSLSKLVPFKKSSANQRAHASVSDAGRSPGTSKAWMPTWSQKKSHSAKPSTWNKVTKSTQDMWEKTKDALTPGSKKPKVSKRGKSPAKPWFKAWLPH